MKQERILTWKKLIAEHLTGQLRFHQAANVLQFSRCKQSNSPASIGAKYQNSQTVQWNETAEHQLLTLPWKRLKVVNVRSNSKQKISTFNLAVLQQKKVPPG